MKGRSRSTLFLMEQLVVIAVFAICAAVCVKILFVAHAMMVDAVDTRHALIIAENSAEAFKAFSGDLDMVLEMVGDAEAYFSVDNGLVVYFPYFVLRLETRDAESSVVFADIRVSRAIDDVELITLTTATRQVAQ
ncbi:MAG: hypothetical protein FWC89_03510 [Defluviitaleaceae bacterium]|nr:hypothetical protein [Defluviitaleaceae bacterium]